MKEQPRTRTGAASLPASGAVTTRDPSEPRIVELRGERFLLRPIRPEDAGAYSDFISRIEETDFRLRFVRVANTWSDEDFARYTQLDHDREMAFVAVRLSAPLSGEIVGEVRAFRYPDVPTAEFAIIVRSDMKRRGLGRELMDRIIRYCRANQLELIGQIAPHNTAMIRLAEDRGMDMERQPGSDFAIAHMAGD